MNTTTIERLWNPARGITAPITLTNAHDMPIHAAQPNKWSPYMRDSYKDEMYINITKGIKIYPTIGGNFVS